LQALATLAALAQPPPSAAHFLKSHQLLVQKFAADRDRQKGRVSKVVRDKYWDIKIAPPSVEQRLVPRHPQ
jgi:hypothetical protein